MRDDHEHLKRCFARWCWPRRDELVPSSHIKPNPPKTWAERFEEIHGEPLAAYVDRVKRDNRRRA